MIGRVGARRARTRSRARDLVAPLAVAQSSGNCGCRRPAPALPRLSVGRSWQTTSTLGKPQIRPFSVTAWLSQEPADKSSPQSSTPTSESDESDLRRQREANSTLELAHSEFIANASSKSKFEISGSQSKGQVQEPPALQGSTQSLSEEGRSTASYRGHEEGGIDGQGKDQEEVEQRKREPNDYTSEPIDPDQSGVGRLSPTSSHLFKLVLPLPRALPRQSTLDTNSTPSDNAPVETAFLLHPSQPLSHVSRLILGSLSPSDRSANVEFRALADINDDKTKASRAGSKSQEGGDDEDGPILHEDVREVQAGDGSEVHELRWSTSTDLGDFVKQSTFGQSFRVVIRPEEDLQKKSETASAPPTLSIRVLIPSFASRTAYLRRRLLKLTRAIAKSTEDKKRLDHEARKGAQRFATAGLGGLVAYWGVVCKLTFFSPLGWDVMEPITYLSGLGTVIGGYLFFLYHNREVSYSSVLDLSVSARQQALYAERGLDVESWTEMVSEAKQLRREIAKIAADYDYDWRGQLEELEDDVEFGKKTKKQARNTSTKTGDGPQSSGTDASDADASPTDTTPGKLDIDAAIDEASELERATRHERSKRKHGKTGEDEELESRRVRGEKKGKQVAEAG